MAAAKRWSWWRRSAVAQRNASTSPATRAATSNAVRPTLNTASENATDPPRAWRERCVDVSNPGTHARTAGSSPSGMRTARPAAVATTPPKSEAAALSA